MMARRRRPKPPLYWIVLACCVILGLMLMIDLLAFSTSQRALRAVGVIQRSVVLTVGWKCLRTIDPEDKYHADLREILWMVGFAVALVPVTILLAFIGL